MKFWAFWGAVILLFTALVVWGTIEENKVQDELRTMQNELHELVHNTDGNTMSIIEYKGEQMSVGYALELIAYCAQRTK
jgi:hypothetical protein